MSGLASFDVIAVLFAQESITSSTIRWIIFALLGIAAALTILTVWFWRHTSPKRRQAASVAVAEPTTDVTDSTYRGAFDADPSSGAVDLDTVLAGSEPTGATQAVLAPPVASPPAVDHGEADGDDGDEWTRLTGPQALPRDRG